MISLPPEIDSSPVSGESEFKWFWQGVNSPDPIVRAFYSGLRADRLSYVFIAGYQSALRLTFDGLAEDEWWCFAASEDRSGELPGVSKEAGKLNGTKTWVAASDHIDGAIVTADGECYGVRTGIDRVTVETYAPGSFLADMSTGKLTLDGVDAGDPLLVKMNFGIAEPMGLVASSLGYLLRESHRLGDKDLSDEARRLAPALDKVSDPGHLFETYCQVADLGKRAGQMAGTADWADNGKLLSMYRRPLEAAAKK